MTRKTPSDFTSHGDWLSCVRREIAVSEQPYELAMGRTGLFRSFYRVRQLEFPLHFAEELECICKLCDPERTAALEALNDTIFRSLTMHLFECARLVGAGKNAQAPVSPQAQIDRLLSHLAQRNPYFALWIEYKNRISDHEMVEKWDEYLLQTLGVESTEEVAFAHAMVELDKLLDIFHDKKLALPSLGFERIWFLHYLRGPERMAQTRAVLGVLTAELTACTFA
jgi:hypothetical protein